MAEREGDVLLPSSIPSGEQTVWADVSTLLDSACTDLRDGELIHGENFSLFAAMSALEASLAAARSIQIGRPIEIKKVGDQRTYLRVMNLENW